MQTKERVGLIEKWKGRNGGGKNSHDYSGSQPLKHNEIDSGRPWTNVREQLRGGESRGEKRAEGREEQRRGKSRGERRVEEREEQRGRKSRWDQKKAGFDGHDSLHFTQRTDNCSPLEAYRHPCWPSPNLLAPHQSSPNLPAPPPVTSKPAGEPGSHLSL